MMQFQNGTPAGLLAGGFHSSSSWHGPNFAQSEQSASESKEETIIHYNLVSISKVTDHYFTPFYLSEMSYWAELGSSFLRKRLSKNLWTFLKLYWVIMANTTIYLKYKCDEFI